MTGGAFDRYERRLIERLVRQAGRLADEAERHNDRRARGDRPGDERFRDADGALFTGSDPVGDAIANLVDHGESDDEVERVHLAVVTADQGEDEEQTPDDGAVADAVVERLGGEAAMGPDSRADASMAAADILGSAGGTHLDVMNELEARGLFDADEQD